MQVFPAAGKWSAVTMQCAPCRSLTLQAAISSPLCRGYQYPKVTVKSVVLSFYNNSNFLTFQATRSSWCSRYPRDRVWRSWSPCWSWLTRWRAVWRAGPCCWWETSATRSQASARCPPRRGRRSRWADAGLYKGETKCVCLENVESKIPRDFGQE